MVWSWPMPDFSIDCTKSAATSMVGKDCQDRKAARLPIVDRSGTPTNIHSGRVRTSIRTARASSASMRQASWEDRSPA